MGFQAVKPTVGKVFRTAVFVFKQVCFQAVKPTVGKVFRTVTVFVLEVFRSVL